MADIAETTAESPPSSLNNTLKAIAPLVPTYTHLILTALLPIVTGAHASLTRPNNVCAKKSKLKDKPANKDQAEDEDSEGDEDEDQTPVETLTAKDAVLFPVTAGITLGSLYLIIKYLDDPTVLSTILTYYFTFMGTFAVGKFFSDSLAVLVSIVFPRRWSEVVGGQRRVYVAGHDRYKLIASEGSASPAVDSEKFNPLPRSFITLPKSLHAPVWSLRRSLLAKWAVVFKLGKGKGATTRTTFWVGDLVGFIGGLICIIGYVVSGKHWIGTNIMGVSFAYTAMQLISPATFSTATLLLSLLFFYDIYFVFFTPMMVTVATNLDVPIKLLFPRPLPEGSSKKSALAMLGLGDVVLPGIMVAMALRFDFWRWCEQRRVASLGKLNPKDPAAKDVPLPKYIKPTGTWGERWWNPGMTELGGIFPKTYFYSSLVGYVAGMGATLVVMHVFNHAQPALLYLVPGVLGAVWGTALIRGEVGIAWAYNEEVNLKEDEKKEDEKKKKAEDVKKKTANSDTVADDKSEAAKVENQQTSAPAVVSKETEEKAEKAEQLEVDSQSEQKVKDTEEDAGKDEPKTQEMEVGEKEKEEKSDSEDEDIELVDEKGEAEYISVKIVKKPAPGAAVVRR